MPWTPLPGQRGNAVISGHRTTHGAPFHEFNDLEPGDRIEVETATGVHVYEVRLVKIVRPEALWVTNPDGPKRRRTGRRWRRRMADADDLSSHRVCEAAAHRVRPDGRWPQFRHDR